MLCPCVDLLLLFFPEKIAIHIRHQEFTLSTLFADFECNICAQDLYKSIAYATMGMCGVASLDVDSGASVEHHKEFTDKEAIRTVMTILCRNDLENDKATITYMDEVRFELPEGIKGAFDSHSFTQL